MFSEKQKDFFKKMERRFLVETPTMESATFPYKTGLSKANVETNRIGSTKWTYDKERGLTTNYFIFSANLISV